MTKSAESMPLGSSEAESAGRRWPWPARFAFRFAFFWFLLQILPFPLSALPWQRLGEAAKWLEGRGVSSAAKFGSGVESAAKFVDEKLAAPWQAKKDQVVLWAARKFHGRDFTERPSGMGSGDTTCDWIELECVTATALGAALLWSLLAWLFRGATGRFAAHDRLHDAWRTLLRFDLATWLLLYGSFKVLPSQMPPPDLDRLCEPVGEMSPMGMLWTFLGSSTAYESFSGVAEMAAGWLLVTRTSSVVGAFVAFAVMGNVFAMNLCYDVPVKIFSGRLMLQGLALFLPTLPRLWNGLVLGRALPAAPHGGLFPWRFANRAAVAIAFLYLGDLTWRQIEGVKESLEEREANGAGTSNGTPLHGVWIVRQMELDGLPTVGDEPELWRRVVVGNSWRLALETNGKSFERLFTQLDPINKKSLTLTKRGAPDWKATLAVEREGDDRLSLTGSFDGREIWVELARVETPTYPLMNRGFHWVNEFPNNH